MSGLGFTRLALVLLSLVMGSARAVAQTTPAPLSVMTFNVRLSGVDDGPDSWPLRRDLAAQTIAASDADVIGTQELKKDQADDLLARLPGFAWFGIDRRGGHDDEHMGIFYRRDRLRLVDLGNFWLSETPGVPGSISWGHPFPRMVTWGLFETLEGGRRFAVYNTHFPYRGEDEPARTRAATLIHERIATLDPALPLVLLGDFNTEPDSDAHRILTETLVDLWEAAPVKRGRAGTFHGFRGGGDRRIDWVLVRGFVPVDVETVETSRDGRYPSDHYPVVATLGWQAR